MKFWQNKALDLREMCLVDRVSLVCFELRTTWEMFKLSFVIVSQICLPYRWRTTIRWCYSEHFGRPQKSSS